MSAARLSSRFLKLPAALGLLVAALGLPACEEPVPALTPTPLASFPAPSLHGTRGGFEINYDQKASCLALPDAVRATVNGKPATIDERGKYTRIQCGGDCALEGRDGQLECHKPSFSVPELPRDGTPITVEITDGVTTFRAVFPSDQLTLVGPTLDRPLTAGDPVTLHSTAPSQQIAGAELFFPDGSDVNGLNFDAQTREVLDGGDVSWTLGEGGCSDAGTTREVRAALRLDLRSEECSGGLVSCRLTRRSSSVPLVLAFPARPSCH
jgi:hypothetical protein